MLVALEDLVDGDTFSLKPDGAAYVKIKPPTRVTYDTGVEQETYLINAKMIRMPGMPPVYDWIDAGSIVFRVGD